jgi:hypothetical protein
MEENKIPRMILKKIRRTRIRSEDTHHAFALLFLIAVPRRAHTRSRPLPVQEQEQSSSKEQRAEKQATT